MSKSNKLKNWLMETHGRYSGWFFVVSVVLGIVAIVAFVIVNFVL